MASTLPPRRLPQTKTAVAVPQEDTLRSIGAMSLRGTLSADDTVMLHRQGVDSSTTLSSRTSHWSLPKNDASFKLHKRIADQYNATLPLPSRSASTKPRAGSKTLPTGPLCPLCDELMTPASEERAPETSGRCVHACCRTCAKADATSKVRRGILPCCFDLHCQTIVDPMVAHQLLNEEDYEKYLLLALWSNPLVLSCPNCGELLYESCGPDAGSIALCLACNHIFCSDCRCPAHNGISCAQAIQKREAESSGRYKVCPRCGIKIEKLDDDTCDHMTCFVCKHEFCFQCMADRKVIDAHGNHHHRPECKFFCDFGGEFGDEDKYLPDKCVKCYMRGKACRASRLAKSSDKWNEFIAILDAPIRWVLKTCTDACCCASMSCKVVPVEIGLQRAESARDVSLAASTIRRTFV